MSVKGGKIHQLGAKGQKICVYLILCIKNATQLGALSHTPW